MDDNYQTYLNRVARMTLPEAYASQVQYLKESPKFLTNSEGKTQPVSFPGYTLMTPPQEKDSENLAFYSKLKSYQQEICDLPAVSDFMIPLPASSFHMTLADLIWNDAYHDAEKNNPNFETELRSCFNDIFQQYQNSVSSKNCPKWQMLGLIIMPRALAICLTPSDKESYEQIISLRRTVYQNPKLVALGIEQQYHFTAHVTLGYFGKISPDLDRDNFAKMLSELNQKWIQDLPKLTLYSAELRKFDDMTSYHRQSDWSVLQFNN